MGRRTVIAAALGLLAAAGAVLVASDGEDRPAARTERPAAVRGEGLALPRAARPGQDEPRPRRSSVAAAAPERLAAPPGRAPSPGGGYLVAMVRAGESVPVRDRPHGRVVARVGDRSDFGSRTALAVFDVRGGGRWLGAATTERPHGRLGWIRADGSRLAYARTERALHVDLSERRLELREGRRVLRRGRVGIGRAGTPTPTGRFGVTDRMLGGDFGWWYGCCIIAFSARQPELPPGWQGGDRVALHGTAARGSVGAPSTAGCLRADDALLRRLMVEVPLGAPIFIRS